MTCCSSSLDFFKRFDSFGIRPSLFFRGKNVKGTGFGCSLTFFLLVITICCFIYFGQNLYYRKSPRIDYHEEYVEDPEAIIIDPEQFPILIELNDPDAINFFTSPDIILAQVSQYSRIGNQPMQITSYNMEVCNESHIAGLTKTLQAYFISKNLSNFFCIPKYLKNLTMEGAFDMEVFRTIKFSLSICQEQPSSSVSCKPTAEIQNLMSKGFIGIYFLDAAVDAANYDKPQKIIPREVFTNFVLSSQKEIDINFENNYLLSDDGVLLENQIEYKIFNFDNYQEMNFMESDVEFLQIYFKIKQQQMIYERSYSKIQDVLGLLGGFINFFYLLGWLLNFLYVRLVLITDILLDIFTIKISQNKLFIPGDKTNGLELMSPLNPMTSVTDRLKETHSDKGKRIKSRNNSSECRSMEIPKNFSLTFPHVYPNNSEILIKHPPEIELNSLDIEKNEKTKKPIKHQKNQKLEKSFVNNQKQSQNPLDNLADVHHLDNMNRSILQIPNENKPSNSLDCSPNQKLILEPHLDIKEVNELEKIELSVLDYIFIYSGLCSSPEREKKKLIINKGLEIMRKCLDVKFIIQKFYEIEKLKQLLLSESQNDLFQYLPKPEIILNVDETNGKRTHSIHTKVLMKDHSMEVMQTTNKNRMSALMEVSKKKRKFSVVERKLTKFAGME